MVGISDYEGPYAAQGMHSCCSGRILCGREVTHAVYAAYAAYGWGPRAERICPGDGNRVAPGPTKQTTERPISRKARPSDNNITPKQTTGTINFPSQPGAPGGPADYCYYC